MREKRLVEFNGVAVEVESRGEEARLFLEAVESGARKVRVGRVSRLKVLGEDRS